MDKGEPVTGAGFLSMGFPRLAMQKQFYVFLSDDRGTAVLGDWIFVTSILVIAIIPCMFSVRDRVRQKLVLGLNDARSQQLSRSHSSL
jgi:hypothetical protein